MSARASRRSGRTVAGLTLTLALGAAALARTAQAETERTAADPVAAATAAIERRSASELERSLADEESLAADDLAQIVAGIASARQPRLGILQSYLAEVARARCRRLSRTAGDPPSSELDALASLLVLDPVRFRDDPEFRLRAWPVALAGLDPSTATDVRDLLLLRLEGHPAVDFEASEELELSWGVLVRPTSSRQEGPPAPGKFTAQDETAPILASVYSLQAAFFDAGEAESMLRAVRALGPERSLLALADVPLRRRLGAAAAELGVDLLDTWGRPYSPWPRDPLTVLRRLDGGLLLLARPNRQRLREADSDMARELVQNLPARLGRLAEHARWAVAPVPFHNGHLLPLDGRAWTSMHGLEQRILEILGLERVPFNDLATADGLGRYAAAARQAMDELAKVIGLPVELVHPLDGELSGAERAVRRDALAGGAGFDLDALVTLLPATAVSGERTATTPAAPAGRSSPSALVGRCAIGAEMVETAPAAELAAFATAYGLSIPAAEIGARLASVQREERAASLDRFLELVADTLEDRGFAVERLPLLLVPARWLEKPETYSNADFLVGWSNVVLETSAGGLRAEGFASLLPSGDERARDAFARAGCRLTLLPPLIESVRRNGGYRCASNHIRR